MKLQVACLLVVVVGALPLHPLVDPGTCPDGIHTACASDGSATCCPIFMSQSGYGCCHLPNASCCPASSTTQGCCPSGTKCVLTGPYAATCVPDAGGKNISATQVCTPGALEPPSNFTVPAAIVIGDSVSIGYTPAVASVLTGKIAVQHSPWAGGGGADDVANGVNCEVEFVRTAMFEPVSWPLISFNFGLHNLDNSSAGEANYKLLLTNFTDNLRQLQPNAKLVYVLTTPFMPQELVGNNAVPDLNKIAIGIMSARNIPVLDLYSHITAYCGNLYVNCTICNTSPCSYHYTAEGYAYIAQFLAPAYAAILSSP